jgi:phosphate-selective porin OprO and OprP
MLRAHWKTAAFGVAGLGLLTPVQGDQITDMQTQIDALRAELSQVQTDQGDNWLNERRAEEVKGLIMEVLSDADMRASLAGDGAIAGHDGEHFFINSADGAFSLVLSGQIDFRYIYNNQDDTVARPDEDEGGFQTRRLKVKFDGHISSPKIGYHVQLARDSGSSAGDIILEEYNVSHQINDNLQVAAGLMKLPFLREELVSSTRQLAVERSTTNEFFTLNRAEGVRLRYGDGPLLINVMVSDGANSELSEFDADQAEVAVTARADYLVQGERSQLDDFTGWSGEGQALNIGGAYHMEYGDGRNGGTSDYSAWTVDAQWENGPLNVFAAWTTASIDPDSSSGTDRDMDGFVVQGGVHIVPDKFEVFARWAYIDGDISGEDEFDACTVGVNYYINGHRTKLTADVIWLNADTPTANPYGASTNSNGLGLITGDEDELAIRTQIQVLF